MPSSSQRFSKCFLLVIASLAAASSLQAYPVNITINATLSELPGPPQDPLNLGAQNPPLSVLLTTVIDSSLPQASYPATVTVTIPGVFSNPVPETGSLSIASNGQISATFSAAAGSFTAVIALPLTFPSPVPLAFGTASFSSPASSVTYNLFGQTGKVGLNGTVSALGLTASPSSISSTYTTGGPAPAAVPISISSNDPSNPSQSFTVAVANASASFLTLSAASGTTPGTVNAIFSTAVGPGTYTAVVQVSSGTGAPLDIPVTYTVSSPGGGGTIQVSPSALSFQFFTPASTSQSQSLSITSSSGTTFTAAVASGTFLTLSSTSGAIPGTVNVTASAAGLASGTYSGSIVLSSPGLSSVTIPVTLNNGGSSGGPSTLSILPTLLRFNYVVGQPVPPPQSLTITNPTPVSFNVSNVQFYLPVTPSSGSTPGSVSVSLNPSGLMPGSYTDTLAISSSGGGVINVPVIVNVSAVTPPPTVSSVTPAAIAFVYQIGGAVPPSQTVIATPSTGNTLTVSAVGGEWLSPSQSTDGTTTTLAVNPANLQPGVYGGALQVANSAAGSSLSYIPITLTVTSGPGIGVSPIALTFNSTSGSVPAAQTIAVATSAGNSLAAVSNSPWLTVTASAATPGEFTVAATPGSLAAGMYSGLVTVTESGTTPQVVSLPVTLNVDAAAAPMLNAVTNGISFQSQIGSPGLIIALWGTGLGPETAAGPSVTTANSLATVVAGTQVFADGIPCPILFSSAKQVNAVLPFALVGQASAKIQLFYQGVASAVVTLPIQPASPAILTATSNGQGGGAILNQDLTVNSAANPAPAGTTIAIYGGGGGQTTPLGADGLLIPVASPIPAPVLPATVMIAGQPAQVLYYGDAPGLVDGVLQINATIPAGTASGPQPVAFTVGQVSSQANVVVYVK